MLTNNSWLLIEMLKKIGICFFGNQLFLDAIFVLTIKERLLRIEASVLGTMKGWYLAKIYHQSCGTARESDVRWTMSDSADKETNGSQMIDAYNKPASMCLVGLITDNKISQLLNLGYLDLCQFKMYQGWSVSHNKIFIDCKWWRGRSL